MNGGPPDARTLVGLLADDDRRAVVAALVLGADGVAEIERVTGRSPAQVVTALGRLVSAGLVEELDGRPHLLSQAFGLAARRAHQERDDPPERLPEGVPESREVAKVFAAFVEDGRILQVPAAAAKRRILLEWLSQDFEPGRRYSEAMVNLILGRRHPDTAAWRRYLVDEGFLSRDQGEYWRSGGAVV